MSLPVKKEKGITTKYEGTLEQVEDSYKATVLENTNAN